MKILCINPNNSLEMTRIIEKRCRQVSSANTKVDTRCLAEGPSSLESYQKAALAISQLVKEFTEWREQYDGFVMACHSDIGVDLLREMTPKPVLGMGEASMLFAAVLGHKFSILSLKRKAIPKKEDLVKKYGFEGRCASVRETGLGATAEPEEILERLLQEGRKAVEDDGAEVLILGCAGMGDLDKDIERELGVPVIDGIVSGLLIIESLIRYDKKTSKAAKYKNPANEQT